MIGKIKWPYYAGNFVRKGKSSGLDWKEERIIVRRFYGRYCVYLSTVNGIKVLIVFCEF